MARASLRRTYLDSSLPSEWNEYTLGARSAPFVSVGADLGSLLQRPSTTLIGATFDKKSAFESKTQAPGSLFERFLNIQRDPNSLMSGRMKFPSGFNQALNMASGFGS